MTTVGGLDTDSSPVAQNDNLVENPTPAARPHDRTLLFLTGLSERSELARLPSFASDQSDEAGRGVTGFAHFCRNKSGSAAGPKPGNTKHHANTNSAGIRKC